MLNINAEDDKATIIMQGTSNHIKSYGFDTSTLIIIRKLWLQNLHHYSVYLHARFNIHAVLCSYTHILRRITVMRRHCLGRKEMLSGERWNVATRGPSNFFTSCTLSFVISNSCCKLERCVVTFLFWQFHSLSPDCLNSSEDCMPWAQFLKWFWTEMKWKKKT